MIVRKSVTVIAIALALMIPAGCGIMAKSDKDGSAEIENAAYTGDSDQAESEASEKKSGLSETSETFDRENLKEQEKTSGQDNTEEGKTISEKENAKEDEIPNPEEDKAEPQETTGAILRDASDLNFTDTDGKGSNYTFTYGGEQFRAVYTSDENWKIYDSYKISSEKDLLIICQVLIDEHPIHGRDMVSFRTAEDMVYEWQIHNMAYAFLKDDDPLKDDTRDVDLDPKDQGLSIEEFYRSRTGKDLDIETILGSAIDD